MIQTLSCVSNIKRDNNANSNTNQILIDQTLKILPKVLTASSKNDPVSRKPLLLHQESDIAVFLGGHQRRQLLGEKVHVVDLSR